MPPNVYEKEEQSKGSLTKSELDVVEVRWKTLSAFKVARPIFLKKLRHLICLAIVNKPLLFMTA
jgi:hypothetical protein